MLLEQEVLLPPLQWGPAPLRLTGREHELVHFEQEQTALRLTGRGQQSALADLD